MNTHKLKTLELESLIFLNEAYHLIKSINLIRIEQMTMAIYKCLKILDDFHKCLLKLFTLLP